MARFLFTLLAAAAALQGVFADVEVRQEDKPTRTRTRPTGLPTISIPSLSLPTWTRTRPTGRPTGLPTLTFTRTRTRTGRPSESSRPPRPTGSGRPTGRPSGSFTRSSRTARPTNDKRQATLVPSSSGGVTLTRSVRPTGRPTGRPSETTSRGPRPTTSRGPRPTTSSGPKPTTSRGPRPSTSVKPTSTRTRPTSRPTHTSRPPTPSGKPGGSGVEMCKLSEVKDIKEFLECIFQWLGGRGERDD